MMSIHTIEENFICVNLTCDRTLNPLNYDRKYRDQRGKKKTERRNHRAKI